MPRHQWPEHLVPKAKKPIENILDGTHNKNVYVELRIMKVTYPENYIKAKYDIFQTTWDLGLIPPPSFWSMTVMVMMVVLRCLVRGHFFRKIFETEDRDFCFKVLFSFNVSHLRIHQSILWVFLSLLCFMRVFFEGALQSITAGGLNLLCWCAARKYTQGFWLTRIIHVDSYYIRRHAHTQGKKRLLLQHASADELQWCQSKMLIRISEIYYDP